MKKKELKKWADNYLSKHYPNSDGIVKLALSVVDTVTCLTVQGTGSTTLNITNLNAKSFERSIELIPHVNSEVVCFYVDTYKMVQRSILLLSIILQTKEEIPSLKFAGSKAKLLYRYSMIMRSSIASDKRKTQKSEATDIQEQNPEKIINHGVEFGNTEVDSAQIHSDPQAERMWTLKQRILGLTNFGQGVSVDMLQSYLGNNAYDVTEFYIAVNELMAEGKLTKIELPGIPVTGYVKVEKPVFADTLIHNSDRRTYWMHPNDTRKIVELLWEKPHSVQELATITSISIPWINTRLKDLQYLNIAVSSEKGIWQLTGEWTIFENNSNNTTG